MIRVVLVITLILFVARFCVSDAAEHPNPDTPGFAPKDSIGAEIYTLCGEPLAILFIRRPDPDDTILQTEILRGRPPELAKSMLAELRQIEKAGGPVHEVALDQGCANT